MSKYVVSHKKGFIALVALVCLTAMIASTWRAYSQTRQVPGLSQGTKPMDSMIANLKRSGVEFPAVELFQAQEASASALTLSRAAAQDVLSKGVVLNPDKRMAQQIANLVRRPFNRMRQHSGVLVNDLRRNASHR